MIAKVNLEDAYEEMQNFVDDVVSKQQELGRRIRLPLMVHQFRMLISPSRLHELWRHSSRIDPWVQDRLLRVVTPEEAEDPIFQCITDKFPHQAFGKLAVTRELVNASTIRGVLRVHRLNTAELGRLRPWTAIQIPLAMFGLLFAAGLDSSPAWQTMAVLYILQFLLLSAFWYFVCSKPEAELRLVGEVLAYAALACDFPDSDPADCDTGQRNKSRRESTVSASAADLSGR